MENTPQSFGEYLKSYFKNYGQLLKNPLALLPTILITGVWILLGFLKKGMNESPVMAVLNFLTFAQGGIFGGVVGAIGGIVGKILVASLVNCLVLPLFVKGAKPMAGFKSGFKRFGKSFAFSSAGALSSFIGGMALALFLYSFLNITQRWQEGLVGIAAAVLLIRSIGRKSGFVLSFLLGFLKQRSGKGVPSKEGIIRFLSGMTLGFTAGTGMNLLGLRWAILIALVAGALAFLLFLLGKSQRAAAPLTCIALLAFVPLRADSELQDAIMRYGNFMQEESDLAFEDFIFHTSLVPTHGWTDEWDHTHDKGAIGLIDGIAGAAAAGAAAGAAAAGAAGGAGGPDFPVESEGFDWDTEERKEEEYDDDGEEEETESGDGDEGYEEEVEEDDYDYEAERIQREKEQEEINKRYGQAHQADWEKFSTTSDEERITKEAEEAMREEEKLEEYRQMLKEEEQRQENVKKIAEEYGVEVTDEEGNEREIWDIEHDTKKAILTERNKGIYQDSLDIQHITAEVELECSEKIAECELVDKVADGTVNVLAEVVPGGKKVKDARDLLKAPLVGASEAYAEGRSVIRGGAGGFAEGVVTVAQNHLEDVTKGEGVTGITKMLYEDTANVHLEGGKKLLNDMISGKFGEDPDKSFENAQNAMVKKGLEIGVGKMTGGNNIATELIMRGHDEIMIGEGDDAKTISDTVADTVNKAKNETLASVLYHTGNY
ncbi:MAG: hypothetical protein GXY24_08275 [Bacteroidales bacterium]|jgi:hypothetical protein|nr:hypothetical protein [Bacteroidales bacterium]